LRLGAPSFNGVDDYVALKVFWNAARDWKRVFDFGNGASTLR